MCLLVEHNSFHWERKCNGGFQLFQDYKSHPALSAANVCPSHLSLDLHNCIHQSGKILLQMEHADTHLWITETEERLEISLEHQYDLQSEGLKAVVQAKLPFTEALWISSINIKTKFLLLTTKATITDVWQWLSVTYRTMSSHIWQFKRYCTHIHFLQSVRLWFTETGEEQTFILSHLPLKILKIFIWLIFLAFVNSRKSEILWTFDTTRVYTYRLIWLSISFLWFINTRDY